MSEETQNNYVTTSYEFPVRATYFKAITGYEAEKKVNGEVVKFKEWSTMLLIPKEDTVTINNMKAIINRVAKDRWPSGIPKGVKITLRDGDKDGKGGIPDNVELGDAPYAGHMFVNVRTDRRPKIYNEGADCISHDADGNHLPVDPSLIVSGDYVVAYINCYAWGPGKFGSGVSWGLKSIQQHGKGEPLGDTDSSTPDFKPIKGGASSKPADVMGDDDIML